MRKMIEIIILTFVMFLLSITLVSADRQTFYSTSGDFTADANWVNPNEATGSDDGVLTHVFDDCAELLCTFGFDTTSVSGTVNEVWLNITWANLGTAEDAFIRYKIRAGDVERYNFNVNPTPASLTVQSYNITDIINTDLTNLSNIYLCLDTDKIGGCGVPNFTVDYISLYVEWTPSGGADTIAPNITLIAPTNNSLENTRSINFTFNATTNDDFANCSLYTNETTWSEKQIDTTITNASLSGINETFNTDGDFLWNIRCVDTDGNFNFSANNFTILIDTVAPTISQRSINATPRINDDVNFSITATDDTAMDTCRLYLNDTGTFISQGLMNATPTSNFTFIISDSWTSHATMGWFAGCNDTAGNDANDTIQTFRVIDSISPNITLISPVNNLLDNTRSHNFTFNATTNDDFANCSLWTNETSWSEKITNTTLIVNGSLSGLNETFNTDGDFLWNIRCYDLDGNSNFSASNFTILIDTVIPVISNQIINATPFLSSDVNFTITATDNRAMDNCFLYHNSTGTFASQGLMTANTLSNFTLIETDDWNAHATIGWFGSCNDTGGNDANGTTQTFTVQNTVPTVTIDEPPTNTIFENVNLSVKYTYNDGDSDTATCRLYLNGSLNKTNTSITAGTQTNITSNITVAGDYLTVVGCNDGLIEINSSSIVLRLNITVVIVDTIAPNITLISPTNNSLNNIRSINFTFNVTTNDGFDNCSLWTNETSWSEKQLNTTGIVNASLNGINETFASDGDYLWNIRCYDNQDTPNSNFSVNNFTIRIDNTAPVIELNDSSPSDGINTTNTSFVFNFTATDNRDTSMTCNLTINGTVNATNTSTPSGIVTNFSPSIFKSGTYTWNITCIDDAANTGNSSTRVFNVDTTIPTVTTIHSPISGQNISGNILVNATVTDTFTNLSTVQFRFENTTFNSSYYNMSSFGNFWNATNSTIGLGDGNYTIRINATDYAGNENVSEFVNITIDNTNPVTTLEFPPVGYFNDTNSVINFNCSATDNHGLENISLYLTNSTNASFILNQSTLVSGGSAVANWSLNLSNGNYTWDCQAYDSTGNFAFSAANRTILINTSGPAVDNPPTISGNSAINNSRFHLSSINTRYNVTITDDNGMGTVLFEIDGVNVTASLNSTDTFNYTDVCSTDNVFNWTDIWANDTIGQNTSLVIDLSWTCDVTVPVVGGKTVNATTVYTNAIVSLNISGITDNFEVNTTWTTVNYPDGTKENLTMTSIGNNFYQVNVSVGANTGTFYYNTTYVNDTAGNINSNTTILNITVTTTPEAPSPRFIIRNSSMVDVLWITDIGELFFDLNDYIVYDLSGNRFLFYINNVVVFCINSTGGFTGNNTC